ncbi:MAG: MarR family transcriptional regulator [Deltaproteobacteria bacterium]|nr:MarR family transcriptional regulator [Deltaproteobacteria bacterium]
MKPRHTPAGKSVTDLILATFRLNGRLLAAGDQLTRDLGLSSARWQVMGALVDGPLPVAQIARNMGLTRQSVQRTVDVLAQEQLVTFAENPYHQRAKLVLLTERGAKLLEEMTRRQATWVNQLAKELSPHELSAAVRLMDTVRQRLEKPAGEETRYG